MQSFSSIFDRVSTAAADAGFDSAGMVPVLRTDSPAGAEEAQKFRQWIEAGYAGEMEYLQRLSSNGRLVRSSLEVAAPWAKSVIVCATNYNSDEPRSIDPAAPECGWIARYAWSGQPDESGVLIPSDYHKVLLARLERLDKVLQQSIGPFRSQCYVDTGPLVERAYAKYAGIGWVGKNTCVLNQKLGSWLLLGVILTDLALQNESHATIAEDRCGSCTRCIDACPTNALTAPYEMDARLCISYLTIEKRGEIADSLRAAMGRQVFGCDICQDVCPWNRKAPIGHDPQLQPRRGLVNPSLAWLAELNQREFGQLFFGSPIKRAKFLGLRRNVAIAMGNSGVRQFLPKLDEWSHCDDPVLAETAQWAINRLKDNALNESSFSEPKI